MLTNSYTKILTQMVESNSKHAKGLLRKLVHFVHEFLHVYIDLCQHSNTHCRTRRIE